MNSCFRIGVRRDLRQVLPRNFAYEPTFILRLDGAPKVAMYVTVVPAILNAILDLVLVITADMGIKGAAIGTVTSQIVGTIMIFTYLTKYSKVTRLYRIKLSRKSFFLTMRNLMYMSSVGMSTFIAELSLSVMVIIGNHMFMKILREDGVAAFSVACYLFPLIFMFGNAIAQSQLPIISYNLGTGDMKRVMKTLRLSIISSVGLGTLIMVVGIFFSNGLLALFLDRSSNAFRIAEYGFPLFSVGFLFSTMNIVLSGFYQSLEHAKLATAFTLARGVIFLIPSFIILPGVLEEAGLWLAVPVAEITTFVCIIMHWLIKRKRPLSVNL